KAAASPTSGDASRAVRPSRSVMFFSVTIIRETSFSLQIPRQRQHRRQGSQGGGFAAQDARPQPDRYSPGFGRSGGFLGRTAALAAGHSRDAARLGVGGKDLPQALPAAFIEKQREVIPGQRRADRRKIRQGHRNAGQLAAAALLGGFGRNPAVTLVLGVLFFGGGHA